MLREPDAPPPPDAPPISSDRALWLAVIERAIYDAFFASDFALRNSENKLKNTEFDPENLRGEARRWLVSDLEPWRTDREEVCDLADYAPDLLQEFARQKLREVREAEREALEAGTEYRPELRRTRRRTATCGGQRIVFEERAEDVARLDELVELEVAYREVERLARFERRTERAAQARRAAEVAPATA